MFLCSSATVLPQYQAVKVLAFCLYCNLCTALSVCPEYIIIRSVYQCTKAFYFKYLIWSLKTKKNSLVVFATLSNNDQSVNIGINKLIMNYLSNINLSFYFSKVELYENSNSNFTGHINNFLFQDILYNTFAQF